jgi:AcrR family transcriptional regulator
MTSHRIKHEQSGRPRDPAVDEALVKATLDILEQEGYAGLSMLGVAKRAGVSPATLYRRWSSKEDLVAAAVITLSPPVESPDTGNLYDDLRIVMKWRARAMRRGEGRVLVGLIAELVRNPKTFEAVKQRLTNSNLQVVTDLLNRAMDRGEIPRTDIDLALDVVTGPFWARLISGTPPTEHLVDDLLPMVIAALKAAAPARPVPRPRRRNPDL